MKKTLALILCFVLLLCAAGCSNREPQVSQAPDTTVTPDTNEIPQSTEGPDLEALKEKLHNLLESKKFKGIASISLDGEPLLQWANGTTDTGEPLTMDSPMYIGSVSKQFCAAAILMLRDQGKLSLADTLDKYFPEYPLGKDITVKHLLTMRSGIPNCTDHLEELKELGISTDNSAQGNLDIVVSWVCSQDLDFETDSKFTYSNTNYTLLSLIVEQASGKAYSDFIRQNILEPLGMSHSGFVHEVRNEPAWAAGLNYDSFQTNMDAPGFVQGAGDLVCTAADLELWMDALPAGKVISQDTFREMCINQSPDQNPGYGCGLQIYSQDHINHTGHIGSYVTSQDLYLQSNLKVLLFSNEIYTNGGEVMQAMGLLLSNAGLTD